MTDDTQRVSRREKLDAITSVAKYDPKLTGGIVGLGIFAAVLEGLGLSFILPIIELVQSEGQPAQFGGLAGAFAAVNLFALLLIVGLFWGVVTMLERTPTPYNRYFAAAIELWIGAVLAIGFLVFANNLAVIFFEQSLL